MELSALTVLVGTVIGASATVAVTCITQREQQRRELWRARLKQNEKLYSEFIEQYARLLVDAFEHQLEKPETMLPAYALINRIRLSASNETLAAAERLLARVSDQYFAPNLSVHEVRELARSPESDPLRPFGEACRRELVALRELL